MKKLTLLFLLFNYPSFAQLPLQQTPTQFDKFINSPAIEWAAYINDTIRFDNPGLNKILSLRFAKNEIKASFPVGSGSYQANQIRYEKKKEIDHMTVHPHDMPIYDSAGTLAGKNKMERDKIDTPDFTLTDVTQILYIQNGQLKTYVPWVATMIPIVTSFGLFLGNAEYFSTCFNFNYNSTATSKDKIIFLPQSRKRIRLDSFDVKSKLKELYGLNLIQSLWPYILKNNFQIYSVEKKRILKVSELNTSLVNKTGPLPIPEYDSLGNQHPRFTQPDALSPAIFTTLDLLQDWQYDKTKNMVFATNREMVLYAKKWTADGESVEATPILKIIIK